MSLSLHAETSLLSCFFLLPSCIRYVSCSELNKYIAREMTNNSMSGLNCQQTNRGHDQPPTSRGHEHKIGKITDSQVRDVEIFIIILNTNY